MAHDPARGGGAPDEVVDRPDGDGGHTDMRLSYGQVFRLFADLLRIDKDKEVALTGRLKHFQRAGFPTGTNVGPGPRAAYGVTEVFALTFAFRLLALRYTPRDAMAAVDTNMALVLRLVVAARARRMGDQVRGHVPGDAAGPTLLRILPDGLEDLRRADFEDGPADAMKEIDQRQVWSWMRGVEPLPAPGLILIDVDALVGETLGAIERLELTTPLEIEKGFHLLRAVVMAAGEPVPVAWNH